MPTVHPNRIVLIPCHFEVPVLPPALGMFSFKRTRAAFDVVSLVAVLGLEPVGGAMAILRPTSSLEPKQLPCHIHAMLICNRS